ncbi:MAG TPA: enoyl-CoA hydratase/isomerase family protein [Steroidobacter sp.]|jgi:enoyl-CoA hydratase|nr:enoyl-CoA hydratase/isomerase family protein [Steroidobacteraceae bacterium]HLS81120.1 enoyl-CoA hydratase/isomerase family protein [Steroidobacter sp.]
MFETLNLVLDKRIAWLNLNRPRALNAIDPQMMQELRTAFRELDDRQDVHVVVLRGEGRAFCAGMDLKWSERITNKERVDSARLGQKTFACMEQMSTPVFAAIHGYTLGGGLELALHADFIVCSSNVRLGLPEITLSAEPPYRPKATADGDPDQPEFGGSAPAWGSLSRLPQLIGKARAKQVILTGEHLDAQRAFELGIVNQVFAEEDFDAGVSELARRLAAINRYNLRLVKDMVNRGYDIIEGHPV